MANRPIVIIPDPFFRLICEGYEIVSVESPTEKQIAEAFQEIVNVMAILLPAQLAPDFDDVNYFRIMEENVHCWGDLRQRTAVAETIGRAFLTLLSGAVGGPTFQRLLTASPRGDDPPSCDPGGGMRGIDDDGYDDDRP